MKMTRILFWLGVASLAGVMIMAAKAFAYDATYNFSQPQSELVAGFTALAGPTSGGPYTVRVDCGKPAPKADGTYDCVVPGITFNPIYGVVVNYDGAKREMATSSEATATVTVQPPSNLKIVVTIRTVSTLTRYGNPTAKTTITRKEIPAGAEVKEGTSGYWNSKTREYITNTTIALN